MTCFLLRYPHLNLQSGWVVLRKCGSFFSHLIKGCALWRRGTCCQHFSFLDSSCKGWIPNILSWVWSFFLHSSPTNKMKAHSQTWHGKNIEEILTLSLTHSQNVRSMLERKAKNDRQPSLTIKQECHSDRISPLSLSLAPEQKLRCFVLVERQFIKTESSKAITKGTDLIWNQVWWI